MKRKKALLKPVALFILTCISVAEASADALTGRLMACSFRSVSLEMEVNTNYRFIQDERGRPEVAILDRNTIIPYRLNGAELTIDDPNDSTLVYDVSKNPILRTFQFCISPGEGGGGSHPVCQEVTETCQLH